MGFLESRKITSVRGCPLSLALRRGGRRRGQFLLLEFLFFPGEGADHHPLPRLGQQFLRERGYQW